MRGFAHNTVTPNKGKSTPAMESAVCKFFLTAEGCKFGDECKRKLSLGSREHGLHMTFDSLGHPAWFFAPQTLGRVGFGCTKRILEVQFGLTIHSEIIT